jgi:uncharacterized protein (TIGR03000 family)
MMAMTGGGAEPAGLFHNGCNGGGCFGSCHGCNGFSLGHGCNGCNGGKHSFFSHGCNGCNGGCYGCNGGKHSFFSHGCNGCNGGCYGCNGGCFGGKHHGHRNNGCCGCYGYGYGCCGANVGCCGCVGAVGGCYGGAVVAPAPIVTPAPAPAPAPAPKPTPKKTSIDNAAPATLVVNVPADARLTIDGEVTASTSTRRVFVSPVLNAGRDYHYTVKAEFVKDGKQITVSKEVAVQAGSQTSVTLNADNLSSVASR